MSLFFFYVWQQCVLMDGWSALPALRCQPQQVSDIQEHAYDNTQPKHNQQLQGLSLWGWMSQTAC